jgi:bacteriocin-like protein
MIEAGELSELELAQVSGGMKTDPNHTSKDVIDARGGSLDVYGVVITYDVNGKVSSLGGVQIP